MGLREDAIGAYRTEVRTDSLALLPAGAQATISSAIDTKLGTGWTKTLYTARGSGGTHYEVLGRVDGLLMIADFDSLDDSVRLYRAEEVSPNQWRPVLDPEIVDLETLGEIIVSVENLRIQNDLL
jgi:hypothetical protein